MLRIKIIKDNIEVHSIDCVDHDNAKEWMDRNRALNIWGLFNEYLFQIEENPYDYLRKTEYEKYDSFKEEAIAEWLFESKIEKLNNYKLIRQQIKVKYPKP